MRPLQLPTVDTTRIAEQQHHIEEKLDTLTHMSGKELLSTLINWGIELLLKIAIIIVVWYVGRWIIRKLVKLLDRVLVSRKADVSVRNFIGNMLSILLTVLLIIIVVDILGLNTTSLLALFASAGLALGIAMSGTLQNFAGGVMVLLLRPYRVGDYISAQGFEGTVQSIQLFNTILSTGDNKTVLIPNGAISTGIVNNYTQEPTRRVEWMIGISYGDDFDNAKRVIKNILDGDARILKDRPYTIEINELAASSVNVVVRCWVNNADFWPVFFENNAQFYKRLPAEGVVFPFAQLDVRILDPHADAAAGDGAKK